MFMMVATTFVRTFSLIVFCFLSKKKLFADKTNIKTSITGGFFQGLSNFGIFGALLFIPGPVVIIIVFLHTLMLLFLLAAKGEMKLTALAIITTLMALLGLSFVLDLWQAQSNLNWWGIAIAFVATIATTSRIYIYGKQTQTRHPILMGAEVFSCTAIMLAIAACFIPIEGPHSAIGWWQAAGGCISMALATFGMFYGLKIMGSFNYSLIAKTEPLFTTLFAALVLGEHLSATQVMGILIVISSLSAYQYLDAKEKAR